MNDLKIEEIGIHCVFAVLMHSYIRTYYVTKNKFKQHTYVHFLQVTKTPEHICGSPIAYFYHITAFKALLHKTSVKGPLCMPLYCSICIRQLMYLGQITL